MQSAMKCACKVAFDLYIAMENDKFNVFQKWPIKRIHLCVCVLILN